MTTLREAANIFGISELGIFSLIRQGKLSTWVSANPRTIKVSPDEINKLFKDSPGLLETLRARPK